MIPRDDFVSPNDPIQYTNIGFGPKACSDARAILHRQWAVGGRQLRAWSVLYQDDPSVMSQLPTFSAVKRKAFAEAQLYWVSNDMVDLIETAAPSVPVSVTLLPELLPDPSGVVFFARSVRSPACILGTYHDETDFEIAALHWHSQERVNPQTFHQYHELKIDMYAHINNIGFGYLTGVEWSWGDPMSVYRDEQSTKDASLRERAYFVRSLAMAFFGLLSSQGVTTTETIPPDRPAFKRAQRDGITGLSDTRVIYLRSARSSHSGDDATTDRYVHRWIVSGHWRSQPYGKDRAYRKPVWIAPHVKGPEGAPLLHGEKVRAVVR